MSKNAYRRLVDYFRCADNSNNTLYITVFFFFIFAAVIEVVFVVLILLQTDTHIYNRQKKIATYRLNRHACCGKQFLFKL